MRKPFEHDRLHDRAVKTKSWAGTELMQLVAIFVVFLFQNGEFSNFKLWSLLFDSV